MSRFGSYDYRFTMESKTQFRLTSCFVKSSVDVSPEPFLGKWDQDLKPLSLTYEKKGSEKDGSKSSIVRSQGVRVMKDGSGVHTAGSQIGGVRWIVI